MPTLAAVLVVAVPVANLFTRPDAASAVTHQAIYSSQVSELDRRGAWVKVAAAPDGYQGWIRKSEIRRRKHAPTGPAVEVTALAAHLYRTTDVTAHAPVLTVPFETRLPVLSEPEAAERRWIEVALVDGSRAWIQRGDTTPLNPPLTVSQTLDLARRFLGRPYTWGGASSFGYDCSAFTQMLCRRRGIAIPRDSRPQSEHDTIPEIPRTNLQPGDLLFFGEQRVTHTGYYIGNGEFIHATAHLNPRIQISRLDDPHWSERFRKARRPQ